jgi:hypothetical protein
MQEVQEVEVEDVNMNPNLNEDRTQSKQEPDLTHQ